MKQRRPGNSGTRKPSGAVRLSESELVAVFDRWPSDLIDVIVALRTVVLAEAPAVYEAIKFNSLCYFKPDMPYGCIGGNVCTIGVRNDEVVLGFLHGAFLPDPSVRLCGAGKSKRHVVIHTKTEARATAIRELIRAALAYSPLG